MGVLLAAGLAFVIFMAVVAAAGFYHYDYRCNDGVKERHYHVLGVPIGSWESVDGDPAGGCE